MFSYIILRFVRPYTIDCQNFVQFSKVYYRCHINVVSAFDNYLTISSRAIIVNNFLKVFFKTISCSQRPRRQPRLTSLPNFVISCQELFSFLFYQDLKFNQSYVPFRRALKYIIKITGIGQPFFEKKIKTSEITRF